MQKYAIAAVLIAAFATPTLAAQYYVALDSSTKQCQEPDGTTMQIRQRRL